MEQECFMDDDNGFRCSVVLSTDVRRAPAADAETLFEQLGLVKEAFDMAKSSLAPEQKWISVKDKLPEEDTLVLCAGAKGGMFLGYPSFVYKDDDYAYTRVPNARGSRHATHWMPLPEPPEVPHG